MICNFAKYLINGRFRWRYILGKQLKGWNAMLLTFITMNNNKKCKKYVFGIIFLYQRRKQMENRPWLNAFLNGIKIM